MCPCGAYSAPYSVHAAACVICTVHRRMGKGYGESGETETRKERERGERKKTPGRAGGAKYGRRPGGVGLGAPLGHEPYLGASGAASSPWEVLVRAFGVGSYT